MAAKELDAESLETPLTPADEVEKSGRAVCFLGLGMVFVTWVVAGLHAINASQVEKGCNVDFATVELLLAACTGALGVIVAVGVLLTKRMFGAVQDVAHIRSQEASGQVPEAQEGSKHAKTVRGCIRFTLCVQSGIAIAWLLLAGMAALEAYAAKLATCGTFPVVAFWPISALNFVVLVIDAFVYKCIDV